MRISVLAVCLCLVAPVASSHAAYPGSRGGSASANTAKVVSCQKGVQPRYVGGLLYSRVTIASAPVLARWSRCSVARAVAREYAMHSRSTLRPMLSGSPRFRCSAREVVDAQGNTAYQKVRCVSLSKYTATVRFRVSS